VINLVHLVRLVFLRQEVRSHKPRCSELSVVGKSIEHEVWATVSRDITLQDVLRVLEDKNSPLYQKLIQTRREKVQITNLFNH